MLGKPKKEIKYPGTRQAMDGNTAVIMCEREASDGAGAYPITPSTQMGEYWAEEMSKGHINISGRPLIFVEPEGEHAAAAVTAGMAMTGLRAINFSSGQGIVYMHESLYPAVGKRLTYILNIGCRALSKSSLNVHASHDDYHAIDDTGFFQVMGKSCQSVCDLNIISHRIAELALNPGVVGQDGFLTTHLIESLKLPERALIAEYLGRPEDIIETPTPAQRLIYGETRRRIPTVWDVDNPMQMGVVQNQDSYMQSVAAQRPFFFEHIKEITDQAMDEYYELTGRRYNRVGTYKVEDAEYLIIGQGSVISSAEVVADYLREKRFIKVGVIDITMFRPFPGDLLGGLLKGCKGVTVLERTDQPLAEDLPLIREIRAVISKCTENGLDDKMVYPDYAIYTRLKDIPPVYSGSFGMGSRDLQPEGLIGVIENMLPSGKKKKFFYLSIDFLRDKAYTPKQEIHQQLIEDSYPNVKELSIHGSENPNLMPNGCITVRFHSVGGWGAMTTGKNLAMTLFDLLGYHIKANPKYGSEKKGQPTTYYLSAAPEPIRINCEYIYVDVVLSPDPNVFGHSNPLNGLKKDGVFVIQSNLASPEAVWATIPVVHQEFIVKNRIRVFYIDGFKIAKEEASNIELQFRMQGIAFQGAFFAASPVMRAADLTEDTLFSAIRSQLQDKFGDKGANVVEDNLRVVRRGFDEIKEIVNPTANELTSDKMRTVPAMPILLKKQPVSQDNNSNIHRFWEQTGNFYVRGKGNDNLADPFIASSFVPAVSAVFRNMTQIRFDHPVWIPKNCTACGNCYTICPDSAIPGLVNSVSEIFDTIIRRVETNGHKIKHLRRAVRTVEKKLRIHLDTGGENVNVSPLLNKAIDATISECEGEERVEFEEEFSWFRESLGKFKFSITKPYYTVKEKSGKGSGGLFSITVNPYTCKGCMECVEVCNDNALGVATQTEKSVETLKNDWDFWLDLPNISPEYSRIDDLDEKVGALETLLLDKKNYDSIVCGDGSCLGCGEKTAVHLFTGVVTALQQMRVKKQIAKLDDLISRLDKHIRLKLADSVDITDTATIEQVISEHKHTDLTLSRLSAALDSDKGTIPLDSEWLNWVTELLKKLKHLKWQYTDGTTGTGRSSMGIVNATGCTSVWGSTFPYNPYPFPWASHLFQDAPSMAMGLFEGHMAKMAEGFKAIRMAELELEGKYNADKDYKFFTYFNWKQFSTEEFLLCPPVVAVGGDGAMYDIGFQNLSRMMMSGMPIKVLVLDTQVYSNTGGQSCTSGYIGQVADMAPFGKIMKGKEEIRKEMGLIGMAHRTSYVLQGSPSNTTHLLEGYIDGLNSKRPALFNIYSVCQPEHGVADDATAHQSKLAVESRAFPLMTYDPDVGETWEECVNMEGNPAIDKDWPVYNLAYTDKEGQPATMELPLTFIDFAITEGRFRKQFRKAPADMDEEQLVSVVDYLELDSDEREGVNPYTWSVDGKNKLMKVLVSDEMIASTLERREFWRLMKSIAGVDKISDPEELAQQVRGDMAHKLSASLLAMATGEMPIMPMLGDAAGAAPAGGSAASGDFEAVWIDTPECTACDECVNINPKIFAYNDKKQAYVLDPKAGPFKDIVKSAEKCTAQVIHPGTPANSSEKGLDKLIKRAEKYQ